MALLGHLRMDLAGLSEDVDALRRVAEAGSTRLPGRIDLRADAGSFTRDLDTLHGALERIERQVYAEISAMVDALYRRILEVTLATGAAAGIAPPRDPDFGRSAPEGGPVGRAPWDPSEGPPFTTLPWDPSDGPQFQTLPYRPGDGSDVERAVALGYWDLLAEAAMRRSPGAPAASVPFGSPIEAPFPALAACVPTDDVDQRRRQTWGW